jgi:hypothetical protein
MLKKPLQEVGTEELESRKVLLKFSINLVAVLLVVCIGYNTYRIVSLKVDSLRDWVGRDILATLGLVISLIREVYALKKIKAELRAREHWGVNN